MLAARLSTVRRAPRAAFLTVRHMSGRTEGSVAQSQGFGFVLFVHYTASTHIPP